MKHMAVVSQSNFGRLLLIHLNLCVMFSINSIVIDFPGLELYLSLLPLLS